MENNPNTSKEPQQTNLLQTYLKAHASDNNSASMKDEVRSEKHDASGHCQQVVHVPVHSRQGHPVAAYDRLCGQKHTAKEAAEKNQEEAKENKEQKTSNQKMTEKYVNLINEYWPHLAEYEGYERHAYLDTEGNITTGIGLYIPDEKSFISLPWQYQGKEATFEQKVAEYKSLNTFQKSRQFGRKYGSGYYWEKSEQKLTISEHFIIDKTMEHLEWDLRQLETKFPEFENYPRSLQMVLLDMQYNMTNKFNDKKWHYFHEGLKNKDISQMIQHVNRPQVSQNRNDWARRNLKEIPTVDGWHYSSK